MFFLMFFKREWYTTEHGSRTSSFHDFFRDKVNALQKKSYKKYLYEDVEPNYQLHFKS